ncbi:MAG: ATP-dependent helicase DinG, partial [Calditrichaeota bacterium]|nr:ATP-dependent helicase DinG [Calditrichota bacterium]
SETKRGTLILFTSYDMLQRVYRHIKPRLEGEGILTLAQGIDGSRNSLVRLFQEEGTAVLLGTNSFWEGVDIPGEALELLVVTKLPFEVPAEPIFQAWMEEIEKRGGNSFFQMSVPMAVLKFRQGFGRLIRTGSDRGMVLILDNRVLRFQYGQIFLDSLPLQPRIFESEQDLLHETRRWFE